MTEIPETRTHTHAPLTVDDSEEREGGRGREREKRRGGRKEGRKRGD
jgi:hypothetical protein